MSARLALAAALLLSSCAGAAQTLATGDLHVVEGQVRAVAGTTDVSVSFRKDRVLSIKVGSVDAAAQPGTDRREWFQRIAGVAYLAFASRSGVDAVVVEHMRETQRFRPIQLIEPSGYAENWVKPPQVSTQLYFVGVGHVRPGLVEELTSHFRRTLDLDIQALPAISFDRATVDADRSQVVAEELVAAIRRRYPTQAQDVRARIIGVTGDDMYLRMKADSWTFGFSWRSDDQRMAVVSYARMDPAAFGLSPDADMLRSRVAKMIAKNIGVLYFGLPLSNNPHSVLYGNIGGTDELDVMTEYFDPQLLRQ